MYRVDGMMVLAEVENERSCSWIVRQNVLVKQVQAYNVEAVLFLVGHVFLFVESGCDGSDLFNHL